MSRSPNELLDHAGPVAFAHRGGAGLFPENTLFAFEGALELGATALELDVRATRDGELVVLHDPTVDRTTNGTGPVSSFTLEQLKRLDAGYRFEVRGEFPFRGREVRIPTFDELARTFEAVAYGGEAAQPPDVATARREWPHVLDEARRR